MKRLSLWGLWIFGIGLVLLSGCGGGSSSTAVPIPQPPSTAVVTLSTAVTGTIPAGTTINSYDITIALPPDVTVKTAATSSQTDDGVVTAIDSATGSLVSAVYTKATGSAPGTVKISMASGSGFSAGGFCRITCNIVQGTYPAAPDFSLNLDAATGFDTNTLSSVLGLESDLKLTGTVVLQ
jgi:hypothetical protein